MSWLNTDPATWKTIIAGDPQLCPDDCGRQITPLETRITDAAGVWRRLDCVTRQWKQHNTLVKGTQAAYVEATKRVTQLGGKIVNAHYDPKRPRTERFHWYEVMP